MTKLELVHSTGDQLVARHLAMARLISNLLERQTVLQYETDKAREAGDLAEGDLADIGYFERELEALLDHHRKESKSRQEAIGRGLCEAIMQRFGRGDGELKARGQYGNASPDVKREPIIPKKDDPDYNLIMESLGIPVDLARRGAVQIHYKHMGDLLTEMANNNQNAPGRLSMRAVPKVTYRSNTRKKIT